MTVSVIKFDLSKKKHPTQLYVWYFAMEDSDQYPILILGVIVQNGGTPYTAIAVQWLVWSKLS